MAAPRANRDFSADHVAPALPEVMSALAEWNNAGVQTSYAGDDATKLAVQRIAAVFETEVDVLLVPTGTAANAIILATLAPPFGAVLCAVGAHIDTAECGAPESLSGGAKLVTVPTRPDGRIEPVPLAAILSRPHKYPHAVKPFAVSVTQPTEAGFCYTLDEVRQICDAAHGAGCAVHMDGARLANALESPTLAGAMLGDGGAMTHAGAAAVGRKPTPADLTWRLGVDALSFGCTKGGTLCCEAVVLFRRSKWLPPDAAVTAGFFRKRGGVLLEKNRFLASQMLGYLDGADGCRAVSASSAGAADDVDCAGESGGGVPLPPWRRAAANANDMARYLAQRLASDCWLHGVSVVHPVQINMVFVEMPRVIFEGLVAAGYKLSLTAGSAEARGQPSTPRHLRTRMCTYWSMRPADVDALVTEIVRLGHAMAPPGGD